MSNTLELIIECLPVADIPELILHYLIGDVSLNSLSSDVFDQVFTRKYIAERLDEKNIPVKTFSYIDSEKRFLHSFFDKPAVSESYVYDSLDRGLNQQGGIKQWYKNGLLHRDGDEPAVVFLLNDVKEWWRNGLRHRDDDLPAVIGPWGRREWWKHGKQHRDGDLPAITDSHGKVWMKNDKLHRDNGLPANETKYGGKQWFINGIEVPGPNWFKRISFKLKRFKNKFF